MNKPKPEFYPHGKHSLLQTAGPLFFSHVCGLVASLFTCFLLSGLMSGRGLWIVEVPVFLVYCLISYPAFWRIGHEDANLANFGHITLDRLRGIKLSLVTLSPSIAFGLCFIIGSLLGKEWFWGVETFYRLCSANVWPLINAVTPSSLTWPIGRAIAAGLFPCLPLLIHPIAYCLGTKDFSISQWLVYRNQNSSKR